MNSLPNKKKIYFRLDAGGMIGQGHLSRCKNLAISFSELNYDCIFVIRKRKILSLSSFPFEIIWLSESENNISNDISSWISDSEEAEASEFLSVAESGAIVILDHYGLSTIWQQKVKKDHHVIIALQDIPSIQTRADVILNYNIGAEKFYEDLDKSIDKYLGPEFAPLDSVYRLNRENYKDNNSFNSVGISLGGVRKEILEKVIFAIKELEELKTKKIDWLVNNDEEKESIQSSLIGFNINFHSKLPNLASFYKGVDVIVGACGVSFLERAILGKWQIVFKVANNQNSIVESITNEKLGFYAGDLQVLPAEKIAINIRSFLNLPSSEIETVTKKAFNITDGFGAKTFATRIKHMEKK